MLAVLCNTTYFITAFSGMAQGLFVTLIAGTILAISCMTDMVDGKIASVDEYWGDDGPAPQWRQDKHIGTKIKE